MVSSLFPVTYNAIGKRKWRGHTAVFVRFDSMPSTSPVGPAATSGRRIRWMRRRALGLASVGPFVRKIPSSPAEHAVIAQFYGNSGLREIQTATFK